MKKAQVETMGLVIIVTLLAFILVFVLQILVKPSSSYNNDKYLQLNSDNLRSSMLKVSLCKDHNLKDEIISCSDNGFTSCEQFNPDCKTNLQIIIKKIINNLNIKNYKFKAGNILVENGICKNAYTSSSELNPYSNVNITIEIC